MTELQQRQIQLECRMVDLTREHLEGQIKDAEEQGRGAEWTAFGRHFLERVIEPLALQIREYSKQKERPPAIAAVFREVKSFESALLISKTVLNHVLTEHKTYSSIAHAVGRAFEKELRVRANWTSLGKRLFGDESLAKNDHPKKHRWRSWSNTECFQIGVRALTFLTQISEGKKLFEARIFDDPRQPGTVKKRPLMLGLSGTELTAKFVEAYLRFFGPTWLPMVCPPNPWTSGIDGGYLSKRHGLTLVKREDSHVDRPDDLQISTTVYEAINAIQATAWRINGRVLDVLAADPDLERLPCVQIASHHRMDKAIYFPHTLDFRGRVYAVPQHLNPQASDAAKALLTFAHGRPIADRTAVDWLAVHGANCYGGPVKRGSFEQRSKWVQENENRILAAARDPGGSEWWKQAGNKWQFLAFCFEWEEFRAEGLGYVSCLPVVLDGTCNGLQHYSAMVRDFEGGKAVNLVPSALPRDIYQDVADEVNARLQADSASPTPRGKATAAKVQAMADYWLAFGIDRKLLKGPVMIRPYGGKMLGVVEQIYAYVRERDGHEDHGAVPTNPAVWYLAWIIWNAMNSVVASTVPAMKWLRHVATLAGQKPMSWVTPTGFQVWQAYPKLRRRRVVTTLSLGSFGCAPRLSVFEPIADGRLDVRKQRTAFAPNFIHSLDAAHLMLTVRQAKKHGIGSFAMIHDCYGTTAADTQSLSEITRQTFADMYDNHDVLKELLDSLTTGSGSEFGQNTLRDPPARGTLDINQVRTANYFFS